MPVLNGFGVTSRPGERVSSKAGLKGEVVENLAFRSWPRVMVDIQRPEGGKGDCHLEALC